MARRIEAHLFVFFFLFALGFCDDASSAHAAFSPCVGGRRKEPEEALGTSPLTGRKKKKAQKAVKNGKNRFGDRKKRQKKERKETEYWGIGNLDSGEIKLNVGGEKFRREACAKCNVMQGEAPKKTGNNKNNKEIARERERESCEKPR